MNDNDRVRQLLQQYIDATGARDSAALAKLFHAQAVMHGYLAGNSMHAGPAPFLQAIAEADAISPGYRAEISALVVSGDIAVATVLEQDLLGMDFTNHFQLLRDDSGWHIVAKLFQGVARS